MLIRRKHSLGYVEFIRGKYEFDDIEYLFNIISLMSTEEINNIKTHAFEKLWNELWCITKPNKSHKDEYEESFRKFNKLKYGVFIKFKKKIKFKLTIYDILDNNKISWHEPEWEFPKGRRNLKESDLDCAIREFNEETNFKNKDYELIDLNPTVEKFIGTNGVRYQHTYYIAQSTSEIKPTINCKNYNQTCEIGNMGWFSYKDAKNIIRDYNIKKKFKIDNIYYLIKLLLLDSNYEEKLFNNL